MSVAELLLPAIRWDAVRGYDGERELIERGLALGVGGFILFGGTEEGVRALTKELRARSRVPLLIAADMERGAGQQVQGASGLPPLAALGWLGESDTVRKAARLTAREARTLGINWDYAPVCDLDLLPENPIVGTRALGGDAKRVAELASEWIDACQAEGVLACAKHFPGHGRTTRDSHAALPVVDTPRQELFDTDLVPFRAAIDAGVASIMTAHVAYPALDPSGAPATLSREILRYLLRDRMRFEGLIVTDAMIMEGVLAGEQAGEGAAAARALAAGCDLILYPQDLDLVSRTLEHAVREGTLDQELVHRSLRRRLKWAQWASPPTDYRRASASDVQWADQLCERVVHVVRGARVPMRAPIEVLVVDDDLGGPYPPPSREPFTGALRESGMGVLTPEAPTPGAGTTLVALYGDIRSWKGRAGYSAETRAAVDRHCAAARALGREPLVVQFSHPRLASELEGAPNIVSAWGGERAMQVAAARWLLRQAS